MRAIVLDAPGPPDVLTIREHPVPTPNREAPPAANVEATRRLPVAPQRAEARRLVRLGLSPAGRRAVASPRGCSHPRAAQTPHAFRRTPPKVSCITPRSRSRPRPNAHRSASAERQLCP